MSANAPKASGPASGPAAGPAAGLALGSAVVPASVPDSGPASVTAAGHGAPFFVPEACRSERFALIADRVFDGERFLRGVSPVIRTGECGRIEALVPVADLGDLPCFALPGATLAPAFVDLQLNGCGGVMFNDAPAGATLEAMHAANLQSGCAAFMPTLVSTGDEAMAAAMAGVGAFRARNGPLPVLGLHLEGPFISPERRGIHNAAVIRPLDRPMREAMIAFAAHTPLMLTLAPECVSDADIRALTTAGVIVALGHSAAGYQRCMEAIAAGASAATHLFNGMPPLTGREPGPVGAALHAPGIWCGVIADGLHAHPASLSLVKRLKGDRCYFVSDATAPAGLPEGGMQSFSFCGQTVYVRDGRCVNRDGTLGGSMLTMMGAVRFGVEGMGLDEAEALRMASLYPARLLGLDGALGRVAPGAAANLVAYDPAGYAALAAVDRGRVRVFESE